MSIIPHAPIATEAEVASGNYVNLTDPDPATITLSDIGHALGMTCRFGGHPRRFYSVAEHSVLVANRLEARGASGQKIMAGLMHDASEAYLHDLTRPLINALAGIDPRVSSVLTSLTSAMDWAIWQAVGKVAEQPHLYVCGDVACAEIREADDWALAVEARHLMPSLGVAWGLPTAYLEDIVWHGGLHPEAAKTWFLSAFSYYSGWASA